jgi:hypothetical protein
VEVVAQDFYRAGDLCARYSWAYARAMRCTCDCRAARLDHLHPGSGYGKGGTSLGAAGRDVLNRDRKIGHRREIY